MLFWGHWCVEHCAAFPLTRVAVEGVIIKRVGLYRVTRVAQGKAGWAICIV
jgi:hypothetical protein